VKMASDAILSEKIKKILGLINLSEARVQLEPHILFLCGGDVDVTKTTNHSIRNMFMNLSASAADKTGGFVLAENFKDWQVGYVSLSDFENDIAYLSSLVVIFLESEGALTEFGLFFANSLLRKKLVIVIHDEFHKSESFIKFGLLGPLEINDQKSVRVYDIDHRKIESVKKQEVQDVLDDLIEHVESKDKTEKFDINNRGHQMFLTYQLIDLFGAVTKPEINQYVDFLGLKISSKNMDSIIYILMKFNMIAVTKKSSQYFYHVASPVFERLDFPWDRSGGRRYDYLSAKIALMEFYQHSQKESRTDKRRLQVINHPSLKAEV
jgi:hypothetical protein